MTLKGSPQTTYEDVEEESVQSFFRYVHTIDSSLQKDALQSQDIKKCSKLQEFISNHCKATYYTVQIKKCFREECVYCQSNPPSLPHEVFVDMHFLPSPTQTYRDKYKKFEKVYRTSITEKDRPSL